MLLKKIKKLSFLFLLIAFLLTLGLNQAQAETDKNFIWRVQSGSESVFLLGSIHMAKKNLYPLDEALEKAYKESNRLVVEANINEVDQQSFQTLILTGALYPEGDTVENHLSQKTRDKIFDLGLDLTGFSRFKPWVIAITLQTQELAKYGFDEQFGLDQYFLKRAEQDGMPILELENVDYQINLFMNMTEKEQDLFLYETLFEMGNLKTMVDSLLDAWSRGDEEAFGELFFKSYNENPELWPLAEKIVFERNIGMADKIREYLEMDGPSLVIVGAGHLVGDRGLLQILREQGFQVNQL